jgi:PAS domain S-box-containing protein
MEEQMSFARWTLCALLLVLTAAPVSMDGLQATSYGGWPALGFATALFLAAGASRVWQVAVAETLVVSLGLTFSYEAPAYVGLIGGLAVVLPALFTQRFLTKVHTGHLRVDEDNSGRYHLVTALAALLCGLAAMAAAASVLEPSETLIAGLMSFLAALTAQLTILPLMIRSSGRPAAARRPERIIQRITTLALVLIVFWPTTGLGVAFLVFPMLGWAAIRATRREAHVQLFLVCLAAFVLTVNGHGPLLSPLDGLPASVSPAILYLFMAACCYLTVPLAMGVEQLIAMTGQATRAATTVERLLESVSGALIIATDSVGRITHYNSGAQETLGYTPEEVVGRSPAMFHTSEEIARQAAHFGVAPDLDAIVFEMVRRGERRDWEFLRKDGWPRMASLTLSEVSDPDGQVMGYIGAGEDITERLRAEEALRTALVREHASVMRLEELDQVKQELVSNVSHELRTPITSIAGYAELLGDGDLGDLNAGQSDAVRRIQRNTGRLGLLVEDLLTLSRAESGQLELAHDEVDLRAVASEVFEMLEELSRARVLDVQLVLPQEPALVLGDAHALERVATNLVANAIKFTPDHGKILVSVSVSDRDVCVAISDTGMGIPEEDQEHLFTRFYRTSGATDHAIQGTGLGLSIVHAIVTQHGGKVSIDSAPNEGTTVAVVLPRLRGAIGHDRAPAAGQAEVSVPVLPRPAWSGAPGSQPDPDPDLAGAGATS